MFEDIYLEPEQIVLLSKMVEHNLSIPSENRRKFFVVQTFGGDTLVFPGYQSKNLKVSLGNLEELARQGLLAQSFSSKGTPNFDITNLGYRYCGFIKGRGEQIEQYASQKGFEPIIAAGDLGKSYPIHFVIQNYSQFNSSAKPIFLSYAHEDQSEVNEIKERLKENGFEYWIDKEDLLPGDDWEAEIEKAIDNAQYVLVFLSPISVAKIGYFQKEVRYILNQRNLRPSGKRYVIPILLESITPPKEFKKIQWLNYWEDGAFDKLIKALSEE